MARERVLRAVQHQRDVAVGALPRLPARPAGEEVRPPCGRLSSTIDLRAEASARRVSGCSEWWAPRMSSTRTGGSPRASPPPRRPRVPGGAAGASCGRSPGVAWRSPRAAGRRTGTRGRRRRGGRRSGVALVLVGRVVLLVDDDQAESARPARRPRSGGRRRSGPRPCAGAATRRSARLRTAPSAAARRCRRTARRSVATVCGVSAISGTSAITPSPRSSAAAAARR